MNNSPIPIVTPEDQSRLRVADAASVFMAMESRFSCRAFTPQMPSRADIETIIQAALRAPSGSNTQPWKIYVLQGAKRDALVEKVCAAHNAIAQDPSLLAQYPEPYDYYPEKWVSPYQERRRACGFGLYGTLGIQKGEHLKMHMQHQRNYRYFDAPIGLHITIDRIMGRGSLLDAGMLMQNIMLAARALGLHTCPQAAWNMFQSLILPHIGAGEGDMLVGTIALGYADEAHIVNTFRTERESTASVLQWCE